MERSWLYALSLGFLLDLCMGNPFWLPYPRQMLGRLIPWMERMLRKNFPQTPEGERMGGILLAVGTVLFSISGGLLVLWLCGLISPLLGFTYQVLLSWRLLSSRFIYEQSMAVYDALSILDLERARQALSEVVGWEAEELTEEQAARLTVETVAENTTSQVVAPLFYLALGGPALGLAYAALEVVDAMVGRGRGETQTFGFFPSKAGAVARFLPNQMAVWLMLTAAALQRRSPLRAFQIWRRDRKKCSGAQTQAVCAGALGIELGGDIWDGDKLRHKPTVGEPLWPVEAEDIGRANWLMLLTAWLGLIFCGGAAALLYPLFS